MRILTRLAAAVFFIAVAAFVFSFTGPGRQFADRLERITRMGWNQILYRSHITLPSTPDLGRLSERLRAQGFKLGAPVFIRLYKKEDTLDLYLQKGGRFQLFASYPICYFSGRFGPKLKQGDRQAPEGFYTVTSGQLNPASRWHRAFNLGYPNVFDRAHGRTGNYLMVHGGCTSIGCYAMTDPVIDEIWRLITAALKNGQGRFHVHAYPFRMTDFNMLRYRASKWRTFWQDLKKGSDLFEETGVPPLVSVCKGRYQARPARPGSKGNGVLSRGCAKGT